MVSQRFSFIIGEVKISLSGIAAAALVGIILNAILPGKDYEFDKSVKTASARGR